MTKQIPKLLKDAMENNTVDVDVLSKHLKIPWIKLDIKITNLDIPVSTEDWREKWGFKDLNKNSYQVNQWNGNLLFGPTEWQKFLDKANQLGEQIDEDCKCRLFRKQFKYDWYVEKDDVVREAISKIFPDDEDLNLVNTYTLPPGGWLFPHRDYGSDDLGLNKIYAAVKWGKGNVFGMYGCGNIPIQQGDVILLNNYSLPHWVYNGSDEDRIVLDISANLKSKNISEVIQRSFINKFS